MTQEDKDLLLKYLCMALPYHVLVHSRAGGNDYVLREANIYSGSFGGTCAIPIPYLRSMSSMTEEEINEAIQISRTKYYSNIGEWYRFVSINEKFLDWLLRKRFDFMDLIPKGLSIEVTKENNPYESNM